MKTLLIVLGTSAAFGLLFVLIGGRAWPFPMFALLQIELYLLGRKG